MIRVAGWPMLPFILLVSLTLAVAGDYSVRQLEQIAKEFGESAKSRVIEWRKMIVGSRVLDDAEKLEQVNRFFNQVNFESDMRHWGEADYWATPLETLTTNGGDCEDISIAKYFALREMGVADERMRLTYVKAVELNQAHMVLTYFPTPDADPLVLDNLKPAIQSASKRADLVPVYSFNGDGLWLARERAAGKRVGNASRVGLWRELLKRMRNNSLGSRSDE